MIRLLFLGDIVGNPGREAVKRIVPQLRKREDIDFVIANSENAAGGVGITPQTLKELLSSEIDILTSGNHAWDKKEGIPLYDQEPRLIRPANYPSTKYYHVPGTGVAYGKTQRGVEIAVVNLMGRVFMNDYDCPFQIADKELEKIKTKVIFVDFHAETTSEKRAIGFFLNGRVSAIVGSHTHVQTADEQIMSGGTAYLTDGGMTGPHDSVIGMDKDKVLQRFLTKMPLRYDVAKHNVRLQGAMIDIDESSGKAQAIRRVDEPL